jgi:FkbM family methyltransferase
MLISLADVIVRHGLAVTGVIHAGAHLGQEAELYRSCGIDEVLWIEANPDRIDELRANVERFGHRVAWACLAATSGDVVVFNVADSASGDNRGMSSSVLPFGAHLQRYPDVRYVSHIELPTSTLDEVVAEHAATSSNLLVLDVQGYELHVLHGAAETLRHTDCVYSEINVDELYRGGALLPELGGFLAERGFARVATRMHGSQHPDERDGERWYGWGEAVWVRSSYL